MKVGRLAASRIEQSEGTCRAPGAPRPPQPADATPPRGRERHGDDGGLERVMMMMVVVVVVVMMMMVIPPPRRRGRKARR